jgi:predicted ATPase
VLLDQVRSLCVNGSVLALFEDIHWADPTTSERLGLVVEQVQNLPVLAILTLDCAEQARRRPICRLFRA